MDQKAKRRNILTLDDFVNLSFTSKELLCLISKNLITRSDPFYTYNSLQDIFNFYFELIRNNNRPFAIKCLELGYLIDPNNMNINYELFVNNARLGNYENAQKYLKTLIENSDETRKSDYITYLYLLSMITDIKENLKVYILSIAKRDLLVDPTREDVYDIDKENKIRTLIFAQKFIKALNVLKEKKNNSIETKKEYNLKYMLIQKAANEQIIFKEKIRHLLEEKKYLDCFIHMIQESQKRQPSIIEKYIIIALEDLLSIIYTRKLPVRIKQTQTQNKTNNIYDLIFGGNYREAESSMRNMDFMQENILYKIVTVILEEIERLMDISAQEMIYDYYNAEELQPSYQSFYELLNKGIPITTINKILRISGKEQFKAFLYSAKMFYSKGDLEEGDIMLDSAKSLAYINDKQIMAIQSQRIALLNEYVEEKKHSI